MPERPVSFGVLNVSPAKYELYDIQSDPCEKNDLSAKYPTILHRLHRELDLQLESYRDTYEGAEYGTASRKRVKIDWVDIKK